MIDLTLNFHPPLAWLPLVRFLVGRAALHTESLHGERYIRTVRIGSHVGWIAARPVASNRLGVEVAPSLLPVLPELKVRVAHLFDLRADPRLIDPHLIAHDKLSELVTRTPGLRVPGALCGFELALRAVLGQQISVQAATTVFGRFVATFGSKIVTPFPGVDSVAPTASAVANATTQQLIDRGLTRRRAATIAALSRVVADGALALDPGADFLATRSALQDIPGIGPWTAEYIAMRALGDADAFPHSDLGLLNALRMRKPERLRVLADRWRPWRAYAALHLWVSADVSSTTLNVSSNRANAGTRMYRPASSSRMTQKDELD